MPFCRSTSPITFCYGVGGVILPVATHYPFLGMEISCYLSWHLHIAAITKKANQIIAFLRRKLGNRPVKEKEQAYVRYPCSTPMR